MDITFCCSFPLLKALRCILFLRSRPGQMFRTVSRMKPIVCRSISTCPSAQCPCREADQTPEHYLQSCSLCHQARQQIWPTCMFHQNQALGVCRGCVLDIQVCGTHGREDLVKQPPHRTQKKKNLCRCVLDIQVCGTHGREDLVKQPPHRTQKKKNLCRPQNFMSAPSGLGHVQRL